MPNYEEQIEFVIKPRSSFHINLGEFWQYKELLYFFTWREIKVRYKQAVLGLLWTLLQPILMMIIFLLLLQRGLGLDTGNIPAPLFYVSGLIIWNLFNQTVTNAAQSMVSNGNIIKKIYFPRLIIPASSLLTASFDFAISLMMFVFIWTYYSITGQVSGTVFSLVCALIIAYVVTSFTAFIFGTFLAAINVKYRDVRYALPFLIQSLFFVTPVMYDASFIQTDWIAAVLEINPLNFAIQILRNTILNGSLTGLADFSLVLTGVLFISCFFSLYIFHRTEAYLADIV